MSKEAHEEAVEAGIDASLLLYFELPPSVLIDDCPTPASEVAGLIRAGDRDAWMADYQGLELTTFTERQRNLIAVIYNWIVNYSDSFRFMKLNEHEIIIANYIRGRFPGRDGLGFFPNEIRQQVSYKLGNTTRNS